MATNGSGTSGGSGKVAADFQKMIHEARDRKKNEALAARIFGSKDQRASSPASRSASGSLTSRAGVNKRGVSANAPRHSAGNVDGEWTHDLHEPHARGPKANGSGAGSLAARITNPNAPPTGPAAHRRQERRAAQVARALIKSELQSPHQARQQQQQQQAHQQTSFGNGAAPPTAPRAMTNAAATATFNKGMSIRGLAGPFVVMAQNFAPGTTAADIESAMTPVGGIVTSCRLIKQHPIVIAEIVFESKEGADNVIATFNNQTADGRVLSVYPKVGNTPSSAAASAPSARPAPPADNDMVVDGSYGFDEPMMETDPAPPPPAAARQPPTGPAAGVKSGGGGGGLYSDNLVRTNRWGRGSSRGGGGFGRR